MTIYEYRQKLEGLTEEELAEFNSDFGGGDKTVDQRVREFVDHPQHERRMCQLLDLETEEEKVTTAIVKGAEAASQATRQASRSALAAIIAALASAAALVVSIVSLARG